MKYPYIFIAILFMFGCSNEANNTSKKVETDTKKEINKNITNNKPNFEELIVGKWLCIKEGKEPALFEEYFTYNADGSFNFNDGSLSVNGTWEIKNNYIYSNNDGIIDCWGEIVSIDESMMILKDTITVFETITVNGKMSMQQMNMVLDVVYNKQ